MQNINDELRKKGLIENDQLLFLEAIRKNKVVSVFYELSVMFYLGVMLCTFGLGYIAYQNIGNIGHIAAMLSITVVIGFGFRWINKWSIPYAKNKIESTHSYFDYLVLLVGLLIIALFTYIQVYFNLVEQLLQWSSFLSAALFIFMAYRYDNKALLSMAITALAAAVGLSISPVNWVQGEFMNVNNLMYTSIVFGSILIAFGQFSAFKDIKAHFRFTFQNFGLLLFFSGALAALFANNEKLIFSLLILSTSAITLYLTWRFKEFLFFIYGSIAAYLTITYFIFNLTLENNDYYLLIYYLPISCIAYTVVLLKNKSHFAND